MSIQAEAIRARSVRRTSQSC